MNLTKTGCTAFPQPLCLCCSLVYWFPVGIQRWDGQQSHTAVCVFVVGSVCVLFVRGLVIVSLYDGERVSDSMCDHYEGKRLVMVFMRGLGLVIVSLYEWFD